MAAARWICEICGKRNLQSEHITICGPCDNQLRREQAAVARAQDTAWSATRKCRKCKGGLPRSRYFLCLKCEPDEWRPMEDPYEGQLDPVPRDAPTVKVPAPAPAPISAKRCARCALTLPIAKFYRNSRTKDGFHYYCRPCDTASSRERHARRQRARAAVANSQGGQS